MEGRRTFAASSSMNAGTSSFSLAKDSVVVLMGVSPPLSATTRQKKTMYEG